MINTGRRIGSFDLMILGKAFFARSARDKRHRNKQAKEMRAGKFLLKQRDGAKVSECINVSKPIKRKSQ